MDYPVTGIYRHFKGNKYQLLMLARDSESGEELVVYKALYGEEGIWVRPLYMWCSKVDINGELVDRFALLEELP